MTIPFIALFVIHKTSRTFEAMKAKTYYSFLLATLVISMCAIFCGYAVLKNYSTANQVSISTIGEEGEEQNEGVKEMADIFFVSPMAANNYNWYVALQEELILNQFTHYAHIISPETPPPNG